MPDLECQKVIDKIVEIAEQKISRAGCSTVDRIASLYCELLSELGAEEERQRVYQHYLSCWP